MAGTIPGRRRERVVFLSGYRYELTSGRLWKGDSPVPLRPKASVVLSYLIGHAGQLVSRDELIRVAWPAGFIGEGALSVCISELRQAFDDHAQAARVIATDHRRGYRLIADVSSTPPTTRAPTLFVGREPELAQLNEWWSQARAAPRIGFVAAEAGVGKTALVDEFATTVSRERAALIGEGRCTAQFGEHEPYLPVLEAVADLCRGPDGARVIDVVRRCAPSWLIQLTGLLDDEEIVSLRQRAAGGGSERMLRQFSVAAAELSSWRPLMFVFEDLHDADRPTLELIRFLAGRRTPARLLILGTYRPAVAIARDRPVHHLTRDLVAAGSANLLPLELFTPDETRAYLYQRLAPQVPTERLASDLHERTEGNALFVVTVVDHLMQRGLLSPGDDGDIDTSDQLADAGVPDEIRALIGAQVDVLPRSDRELLETAAAAGLEFDAAVVAAGLAYSSTTEEVERQCDLLARDHLLLQPIGLADWPDGTISGRYRFVHQMHRDVLYERLSVAGQMRVHRRIGNRLATAYGTRSAEIAGELAEHFERGHAPAQAVGHLCAAAEVALARSASAQVWHMCAHALELLDGIADATERTRRELDARRLGAAASIASWGWREPESVQNCLRLKELADQLVDPQSTMTALIGLHHHAMAHSDLPTMRRCGRQMDTLSAQTADSTVRLVDHFLHLAADSLAGSCLPVWERANAMLRLYRAEQHQHLDALLGDQLNVTAHLYASNAGWQLGYPDRALVLVHEAVQAARRDDVPAGLARALWHAATIHAMRGEPEQVRATVVELDDVSARHELGRWRASGAVLDAWALGMLGDPAEGLAALRAAISTWQHTLPLLTSFHARLTGQLCLAAGDVAGGLAATGEALGRVTTTGQTQAEPELLRLRGELMAAIGDHAAAEAAITKAVWLSEQRAARSFQLRAATSLARLQIDQGRVADAEATLRPIYAWFVEGHTTGDLQRAQTVLATCSTVTQSQEL